MGDPACWLDRVCDTCGRVNGELDADGRCADCRSAPLTAPDDRAATEESTMDDRHAPRRTPEVPAEPLDLAAAGDELLATARSQRSGRAARTLLPGSPAPLTQTLLAITAGSTLADHAAPGPASLHVLQGSVVLRWEDQERRLEAGAWTPIPDVVHGVDAETDAVALLSVAHG